MFNNRLFHLLLALAFVTIAVFAVQATVARANRRSGDAARTIACESLPSRHSIHTEYEPERGMRVTYTEDGPAGVDGGMIELRSNYRICAR